MLLVVSRRISATIRYVFVAWACLNILLVPIHTRSLHSKFTGWRRFESLSCTICIIFMRYTNMRAVIAELESSHTDTDGYRSCYRSIHPKKQILRILFIHFIASIQGEASSFSSPKIQSQFTPSNTGNGMLFSSHSSSTLIVYSHNMGVQRPTLEKTPTSSVLH